MCVFLAFTSFPLWKEWWECHWVVDLRNRLECTLFCFYLLGSLLKAECIMRCLLCLQNRRNEEQCSIAGLSNSHLRRFLLEILRSLFFLWTFTNQILLKFQLPFTIPRMRGVAPVLSLASIMISLSKLTFSKYVLFIL